MVALATLLSGVVAAQGAETLSGSGVVIGAKGEILTNAHVVEGCQTITVKLASGNSKTGALVARDERNDLAVVRSTGTNNPPTSVASFREGAPLRAGDAIVALGYPLSGVLATDANLSVGNVSALAGLGDDSRYLQISAPVQPGNSGGPLLDASGHLVGIVTAKLNAVRVARFTGDIPQNVNFALKAEVARTFLDSKGIAYQTARSDQQLSPADVGDIARPFTVHIECEQAGFESATAPPIASAAPPNRIEPTQQQIDWCTGSSEPSPDLMIDGCTAVIQSGPRAWAFNNRGSAYGRKGDYDRAIADSTEAIRLDPKDAHAYNNRGHAYYGKGDYDRAIGDYTEAIRLDPKDAKVFENRGVAYNLKGDFDRAIADSTEAIRLDPKFANAFNTRGNAYLRRAEYDRAIADYTEAIRLDPKDANAFNTRGNAYKAKGDYDRAIADYDQAITLSPKYAFAYFDRALAYLYAGSLPKALADLDRSSELDPKYPYTAIWLDIVYKRSNLPSRLAQAMSQIDMTNWPAPVIRLYLGQLTPAAVLAAAADLNADTKRGQVCEANFYGGELALQQGAKEKAARQFRLAAAHCPKGFIEWPAANVELKALGKSH